MIPVEFTTYIATTRKDRIASVRRVTVILMVLSDTIRNCCKTVPRSIAKKNTPLESKIFGRPKASVVSNNNLERC